MKAVAHPVLAHRLHLQREALLAGTTEADVVADVLRTTPVPVFPAALTGAAEPQRSLPAGKSGGSRQRVPRRWCRCL